MNPRKSLLPLATALALLLGGVGPAPASLCGFEEIAIFAFNSVHLSRDSKTTGDVVANSQSAGPVLDEGAEVALDRNSVVTGNVSGHTIDLDKLSTIDGDATYVEIVNQGTITGTQTIGAPPYTDVPAFQAASPGIDDVLAGPLQTVVLGDEGFCSVTTALECTPGGPPCPGTETCVRAPVTAYNDIQLLGGTVVFSGGGAFDVASISGTGRIEFDAPTSLRVAGRIDTEASSYVGPKANSAIDASDIVIYVGGPNGGAGGPLDTPFAVNLGQSGTVHANVYAPNGTIEIDKNSIATGAFLGRDVEIQRGVQVFLDSAFVNEAPIADALTIGVVSNDPVTFEVTGSDPEGDSLAFSIEIPASHGTATILDEIQDLGRCSETVATVCDEDADCPGVETCVLPPVSRATVEYDPDDCALVDDELTCPTDAFTFGVRDSCGTLGTAVVDVNPDDPGAPPPVNAVAADDIEVDVEVGSVSEINLSAGAPESVLSLTFAVETLPSAGSIADEASNPITTVPFDLPSPVVVYTAPAAAGADDFTFSARDSTTGSPPCGSPSCDTGTVNISIGERPPLAQPLSVETSVNQPVQITLQANPGGTGTGAGPQSQQSVSSPGYTYFYEAQPISSGGNNGVARHERLDSPRRKGAGPQPLAPVGLAFDAGWAATMTVPPAFFWTGGDGAIASSNFTFTGAGCLSVTDDFDKGDQFEISDNGTPIFTTSSVQAVSAPEVGPDGAYLDPTYSSGSFTLGAGAHDITIKVVVSPYGGGRGYIRVDSGSCLPNLEVTSFSAPDSAFLDEPIGGQILATVTNTGFAAIPPLTNAPIGYYISTDAVITTADRLLKGGRENLEQQAAGGLAVGESVQINLFSGASIGSQFPDESPLTGSVFIGVLVDEFDAVAETDEGDNTASEPIDVSASAALPLSFRIETLPAAGTGTLLSLTGVPIAPLQTFAAAPTMVFQPAPAFTGNSSFTYSVTEGPLSSFATVGIVVSTLFDNCTPVGRDPGCSPGGGSGPQSQGPSQEELEREVAAGPSRGLTITVEGAGSVATSSIRLTGNRVLRGLICGGGTCNKVLPEGAEISLFARPEGANSEFVRWEGACGGTERITSVRLADHTRCTAVFGEKAGE